MGDPVRVEQNTEFQEVPYLAARNRSFYSAFFQAKRPVTSQEINLIQQIQRDAMGRMAASFAQPGFSFRSSKTTNWQTIYAAATGTSDPIAVIQDTSLILTIGRTMALVGDMPIEVGTRFGSGELSVDLGSAPQSAVRKDFVILEVWNAAVGGFGTDASDQDIFSYGYVRGGTEYNDILQTTPIDTETTRRIQTRWRVRVIQDVDFAANPSGFANANVTAQGENSSPIPNYTFVDMGQSPTDDGPAKREYSGLWRAGNHTKADAIALGTTDGYVYALPMFIITRTASVTEPQIDDIRQLTNGNLIGVFEFLDPCTLIIKALPIHMLDCSGNYEEVRITDATSPLDPLHIPSDNLYGIVAAKQLQSTATAPTPPFIVNSAAMVSGLNANFIQGASPGNTSGNILLLDNKGNAVIGGTRLSISDLAASGFDSTSLENVEGSLWLEENTRYDVDSNSFHQVYGNYPSAALNIDRVSGRFGFYFAPSGLNNNAIAWGNAVLLLDKVANLSTFTTNLATTAKMSIGNTNPGASLDVTGNVNVNNASGGTIALNVIAGSGDAIVANATAANSRAIRATNNNGDGIYAVSSGPGSAAHLVNTGNGASLYAQGISIFSNVDGSAAIGQVGINKSIPSPGVDLDVNGVIQTLHFRMRTGAAQNLYLQSDADGNASWQSAPIQVITEASGAANFLPVWMSDNTGLGNSSVYQFSGTTTLGFGLNTPTSIPTPPPANIVLHGGLIVNYDEGSPTPSNIPDTIGSTGVIAQGAISFGKASPGSPSTTAIFSNRVALTDTNLYSNLGGLSFMVAGSVMMVMNTVGNFGMGITHVDNTAQFPRLTVNGNMLIGSAATGGRVDYSYLTVSANSSYGGTANRRAGIQFTKGALQTFSIGVDASWNATPALDGSPGDINTFYIKQHASNTDTPLTPAITRLLIDSNGQVGIGTGNITPLSQLHVIGNTMTEGVPTVIARNDTTAPGIVLYRRFIGNTNPSYINFDQADPANENATRTTVYQIAATATSLSILDTNKTKTRWHLDSGTGHITFGSASSGVGQLNIASPTSSIVMSRAATGLLINATDDALSATSGTVRPLASFGSLIGGSNIGLTISAHRLGAGTTPATSALSFGISSDDDTAYLNNALWFFPAGGISIGSNTMVFGNALQVAGNQLITGNLLVNGNINSKANNIAFGSGFTSGINSALNGYPYLSISTSSLVDYRTGIIFYSNLTPRFSLGVDLGTNLHQNFFIMDEVVKANRLFIDGAGNVGIGVSGSTALRGRLDVVGGAIVADQLAVNDVITDITPGGPWQFVAKGSSLLLGLNPQVTMKIGSGGSYGVDIGTTTLTGGGANNAMPLYVHADSSAVSSWAAAIYNNSLGGGLIVSSSVGTTALYVQGGNINLVGGNLTGATANVNVFAVNAGALNATGNITGAGLVLSGAGHLPGQTNSFIVTGDSVFHGSLLTDSGYGMRMTQAGAALTITDGSIVVNGNTRTSIISGGLNVGGLLITQHLENDVSAVMAQSIQLYSGGGRLHVLLGQYINRYFADAIYINPSDPHNVLVQPISYMGLVVGANWLEVSSATVNTPAVNTAGYGTVAVELVAYAGTPVTVGAITYTPANFRWRIAGSQDSADPNSYEGYNNALVLAKYYHTAAGLMPMSKTTSNIDYIDSRSVGLCIRQFSSSANDVGGQYWQPSTVQNFWVDQIAGTNFPIYEFYLSEPMYVTYSWNAVYGTTQEGVGAGATGLYLEWSLLHSTNNNDWNAGADVVRPISHFLTDEVGGTYGETNTWTQWYDKGTHYIRQHVDASARGIGGPSGLPHSFLINLHESNLQMIFWNGKNPPITSG